MYKYDHSKGITEMCLEKLSKIYNEMGENICQNLNLDITPVDPNNKKDEGNEFKVVLFKNNTILKGTAKEINDFIIYPLNTFFHHTLCNAYDSLIKFKLYKYAKKLVELETSSDERNYYFEFEKIKEEFDAEDYDYFNTILEYFSSNIKDDRIFDLYKSLIIKYNDVVCNLKKAKEQVENLGLSPEFICDFTHYECDYEYFKRYGEYPNNEEIYNDNTTDSRQEKR